jgi:hypothetical protein
LQQNSAASYYDKFALIVQGAFLDKYLTEDYTLRVNRAHTKGIELAILDFGIDCQIDGKDHLMQSEVLPSSLLLLAGNLGLSIELSFYSPNMQEVLEKQRKVK